MLRKPSRGIGRRGGRFKADWTLISSIAACAAAAFSAWSAFETRHAALEAARATRATVWMQELTIYADPEMLGAMSQLRWWQRSHDKDFNVLFLALLEKEGRTTEEEERLRVLNTSRRKVSLFFGNLKSLCDAGIVDTYLVRQWAGSTYSFLADVFAPMERAHEQWMYESGSITKAELKTAEIGLKGFLEFYNAQTSIPETSIR